MKTSVVSGLTGAGTMRPGIANTTELTSSASIFRSTALLEYKKEDQISPSDQVLLEWKDIRFFVPVKKQRVPTNKE